MKLELDISDVKSQEIIQKGLEAFDEEELHEILREIIIEKMKTDTSIEALFYTKERQRYGGDEIIISPGVLLKQVAAKIDVSPALKEVEEKMIQELKDHHQDMMERVILRLFLGAMDANAHSMEIALRNEFNGRLENLRRNNNLKP